MTLGVLERMNVMPMPHEGAHGNVRRGNVEGFVDEEVVRNVLARGVFDRVYVKPEELVLSSSDEDYAGWALPVASPFRERGEELDRVVMRASGEEAGLENRYRVFGKEESDAKLFEAGRGWWLLGMAGAVACTIVYVLLMGFTDRGEKSAGGVGDVPLVEQAQADVRR